MVGTARCYGCDWCGPLRATERDAAGGSHCWKCGNLVRAVVDPVSRQDAVKHQGLIARAGAQATLRRDLADRQRTRAVLRGKEHQAHARQAHERVEAARAAVVLARAEVVRCQAAYVQAVTQDGRDSWAALHAKQQWIAAQREAGQRPAHAEGDGARRRRLWAGLRYFAFFGT
jgi:hypothetical protein